MTVTRHVKRATGVNPGLHHVTHEQAAEDEVGVAALSGLLADAQTPLGHASTHEGGTDALTLTSIEPLACRIRTGNYTGNGGGAGSPLAITGVGFQPKVVWITPIKTGSVSTSITMAIDSDTAGRSVMHIGRYHSSRADMVVSLDADGFSVADQGDDSDPNKDGQDYAYVAFG